MIVEKLYLNNFRNIEDINAEFCTGVNIIYGENAQGKTNIIEALWLFTGYRSFRGSKDRDLIMFGKESAKIKALYQTSVRKVDCEIIISDKRRAYKNAVPLLSPSELLGEYPATVFSPSHLSLIKEGPAGRRKFLDIAICQLSPGYTQALKKYRIALAQRNMLLKDVQYHGELYDTLEMWEAQLAAYGAKIVSKRQKYINGLTEFAEQVYDGICGKSENYGIMYVFGSVGEPAQSEEEIRQTLIRALKEGRKTDIILKTTGAGPHRDDLRVCINGKSARAYGSQGQQRSAALALKLGEAEVIRKITGEKPIVLLDDVMSELDRKRQDYVLNKIKEYQVVITCCEPSQAVRLCDGKAFRIEKGRILN